MVQHGDADRRAGLDRRIEKPERRFDRLREALGESPGVGFALAADLQHREFVAAEPRDEALVEDSGAQFAADVLQQLIADGVAQRVVDVLEVVEIDDVHRKRARGRRRGVRQPKQLILERPSVRKIRQRVVARQKVEASIGGQQRLLASIGELLHGIEGAHHRPEFVVAVPRDFVAPAVVRLTALDGRRDESERPADELLGRDPDGDDDRAGRERRDRERFRQRRPISRGDRRIGQLGLEPTGVGPDVAVEIDDRLDAREGRAVEIVHALGDDERPRAVVDRRGDDRRVADDLVEQRVDGFVLQVPQRRRHQLRAGIQEHRQVLMGLALGYLRASRRYEERGDGLNGEHRGHGDEQEFEKGPAARDGASPP